jgi:hypothetical protein
VTSSLSSAAGLLPCCPARSREVLGGGGGPLRCQLRRRPRRGDPVQGLAAKTLAPSPPSVRPYSSPQPARFRSRGLPATMEDWGERLPPPPSPPLSAASRSARLSPRRNLLHDSFPAPTDHAPPSACRCVTLLAWSAESRAPVNSASTTSSSLIGRTTAFSTRGRVTTLGNSSVVRKLGIRLLGFWVLDFSSIYLYTSGSSAEYT